MKSLSRTLILAAGLTLGGAAQAVIQLSPTIAGPSGPGNGAQANFIAIDGGWKGSSVLWDETNRVFGQGEAIGNFSWGTGIWGLADWRTITAPGSTVPRLASWSGVVSQINHGDTCYNGEYGAALGVAQAVPLSLPGGVPASACAPQQPAMAGNLDNWIARYTGYIRITEAGVYRFSNLYDDGFFLDIYGAPGQKVSSSQDYLNQVNRRQGEDLLLGVGLYAFELGSWERLEAGVIDLRWLRPGQSNWELVPSTHLLASVPLPGTVAFGALGALLGLGFGRRGRADQRR